MELLTSMDFTVAVVPDLISIEQDMIYIKSALLYSDTITLASPVASLYFQLTDNANDRNEKSLYHLIEKVIPLCQKADPELCVNIEDVYEELGELIRSGQYNSLPMNIRYSIKKTLQEFSNMIKEVMTQNLGKENCETLKRLIKLKKVRLYKFQNSINNDDDYAIEFYDVLKKSVCDKKTFPLFDKLSNDLIKAAINDGIITLNDINEFGTKHAKLANELIITLPSFEYATVDEILDIRKELNNPLVRFRNKLLSFDNEIQSMPWDDDFRLECMKLYQQEVAPAILEIDELTRESSFLKNLGYSFLTDESAVKNAGGLILTVAMAGAVSALSDILSSGQALITSTGAYTASKIATAFKEYKEKQNEISRKDMYFYYKAGKLLERKSF